jgi:ABC-type phosphate transport system auxiliary subunit
MSTPLEKVYDILYSLAIIDLTKHPEMDINVPNNIIEVYLDSALYDYEENLGKVLTISSDKQSIDEDMQKSHIKILGRLIYKNYLERELNLALQIANHFNKRSELTVTGLQPKINALRDCLDRNQKELNRSFTRNIMKGINT